MKIFFKALCQPISNAMFRVERALREGLPKGVTESEDFFHCDLEVVHAISMEARPRGYHSYAVIQYCTTGDNETNRADLWTRAQVVWSYYDLPTERLYRAPLGVDASVFKPTGETRERAVVTSGYVSGPDAEAIEEVAEAAFLTGLSVWHVGPSKVVGMRPRSERTWRSFQGITDKELSSLYSRARWVSGLRHREGFELPVIEGALCGARPIAFDQPNMRHWHGKFARFVPETSGSSLVRILEDLFSENAPVSEVEQSLVRDRFDWRPIVKEFWERAL